MRLFLLNLATKEMLPQAYICYYKDVIKTTKSVDEKAFPGQAQPITKSQFFFKYSNNTLNNFAKKVGFLGNY